jgi:hypothetical protein
MITGLVFAFPFASFAIFCPIRHWTEGRKGRKEMAW